MSLGLYFSQVYLVKLMSLSVGIRQRGTVKWGAGPRSREVSGALSLTSCVSSETIIRHLHVQEAEGPRKEVLGTTQKRWGRWYTGSRHTGLRSL